MKLLSSLLLGVFAVAGTLAAAEPVKQQCHCTNCKCTPESNCGCYSEKGCHCGPSCDGTNCAHQVATPDAGQPQTAPKK